MSDEPVKTPEDPDKLIMWVVYKHPTDYPDEYVARKHAIDAKGAHATQDTLLAKDHETIVKWMRNYGLRRIHRHHTDDPVIMEIWL